MPKKLKIHNFVHFFAIHDGKLLTGIFPIHTFLKANELTSQMI